MTKSGFSFSLLDYESQHADPNFVTVIAVSSFLFAFIVVVLVALVLRRSHLRQEGWLRGKAGYRNGMMDAVKAVVVIFAVAAVPLGAILYANINIIKNDRADEQAMIADSEEQAMDGLVDPIVEAKLKECVKFNSPRPAKARASLTDWCSQQLKTGIFYSYRNLLIRCFSGIGLDAEKLKPGSAGIDTCLNDTDDYWNSFTETYSTFLESDSCSYIAASNSNYSFKRQFCPNTSGPVVSTLDDCDGTDSCYEQDTSNDFTEEDMQDDYDHQACSGDCYDMDNDGRTWDDYDADGDGRYEP